MAGRVVAGKGYGILADTLVGLAGAFIGGFLFTQLRPSGVIISGTIDELIVAFIGAILLLALLRLVNPHGTRH